jgi:hypothetical protein
LPEKTNCHLDVIAILFAAAAAIISFLICRDVLGFITHVPDESSYVFQGRILGAGKFWLDTPQVPEGFRIDHILMTKSRWISMYPPGWPILLSIGWLFGNPWIVNPIITFIAATGVWKLAKTVFDSKTALMACILFCISPFVLLMGSGQMAHMPALCAAVWSLAELFEGFQTGNRKNYFFAGILAGVAFLIRPFSSVLLLFPALLWTIKKNPKSSLLTLSGILFCSILFLTYNAHVFGDPFFAGYRKDSSWQPISFSLKFFGGNFWWYLRTLSESLWRWPWPDLVIFIPFIFLKPKTEFHWILIACSLSLFLGYCFFSYKDLVYSGPRYVFEMIGFMCVLAAGSLKVILEKIPNRTIQSLIILPLVAFSIRALPQQLSDHFMIYHGQSDRFVQMIEESPVGKNALILLAGDRYTLRTFLFLNALNPKDGERVFMYDIPEKRGDILKAYPRKETWKFTITLDPQPAQNPYVDRWRLRQASIVPVNSENK